LMFLTPEEGANTPSGQTGLLSSSSSLFLHSLIISHISLISRHHVIYYVKFPVRPSHLHIIPIETMS
jgi:hypothetical protein